MSAKPPNALKCYVHQDIDAVGVCSSCGRGVCRRCAVKLAGKIYCREEAGRVISKRTVAKAKTDPERGIGVMLGSVSAYLLGGVSGLVGCMVIFSAMVSGESSGGNLIGSLFSPDLSFLGGVSRYPSATVTSIGAATLIFGFFGIAAGFYTWRPTRAGAVMSIVFGVLGLVAAFELSSIAVNSVLIDLWFGLSGLTIAMSFIGLVQLTKVPARPVAPLQKATAYPVTNNY